MSCSSPDCGESNVCNASKESVGSEVSNFITAVFGSITKTCINNQVVWTLPCNLDTGDPNFPRNPNEGIACYFLRFITAFSSFLVAQSGNKGYRLTTLSNANLIIFRKTDVINQDFNGTLSGPVTLFLTSNGATNGDEFFISFKGLVITAINALTISSDGIPLLVLDTPGTVNGLVKAVYTGTVWTLTLTSVNIT